ncbi:VanZ family protein [Streptomyces sp. NPDC093225]|uniref:VanZ family protein n=1 Tax=Streptomyces sp. NPDC093225 TaxID=3366034 RepID=UPI00381BD84F
MQQRHELGGSAAIRLRAVSGVLLFAHLALVGWLTLRPLDVPWAAAANLTPLEGIRTDLAYGPVEAARRIGEGLALLAPLGVLLPMAGGRLTASPLASFVRTTAAAALISLGILFLQTGVPGQVVDVDAVLLNATGVAVAHLAVVPALRSRLRRTHPVAAGGSEGAPSPGTRSATRALLTQPGTGGGTTATGTGAGTQGSTPRIPRVGIAPWSDVLSAVPREY